MASVEADEWLQLLAHHPMFEVQDADDDGQRSPGSMSPRQCLAVRGVDLFAAVGGEVRWISLKACKDAYVRHESRRMGLRGAADEGGAGAQAESGLDAVRAVPWFRLGCESLSFEITKLAVNGSGKFLAVVGSHQVAVVVLPASGAGGRGPRGAFTAVRADDDAGAAGTWVDCRSMLLGMAPGAGPASPAEAKKHTSDYGAGVLAAANWSARTRVVDVLWHALSANDSHLVTLQASGSVKVFDVSEDVDRPEQTLSLFSAASGAGFAMSRAASFCMGSAASAGWARVTAYVLTTTGELYSLCPVLPRRCTVEQAWVEALLETAELDVREWQAEEYGTAACMYTPPELADARAAAAWLGQLLELGRGRAKAADAHSLPAALTQPVAAQGPYLFQPEPAPTRATDYDSDSSGSEAGEAECDADDACAVVYMEAGSGTGVGVVAIAYCDAHVEVFADLEPAIGRWMDTAGRRTQGRDPPVLATLASVDLAVAPLHGAARDAAQVGRVALVADVLSPTVFYALHTHGVHRIDTHGWTAILDRAIGLRSEADRGAALDRLLAALDGRPAAESGGPAQSCVQCIVHTRPSAARPPVPVIGAVAIDDIYLSYSLLALVAPSQIVGVSLSLAGDSADPDDADSPAAPGGRRRLDTSAGAKDVVYVPRLPARGPDAAPAATQQPRLVLRDDSRGETGVSEERLKLLGSVAGQVRGQLAQTAAAQTAMQKRLELQAQEHRRQHDKLAAVAGGFQQHLQQMRQSQRRLDAVRDNGRRLALRADQLLRRLLNSCQPELSAPERAFARDVRDIDVQINGADGCHQRVDRLQERVRDMQALARLAGSPAPSQPQLSAPALAMVERVLDDEQSRLKDTCARIAQLQDAVDSLPREPPLQA